MLLESLKFNSSSFFFFEKIIRLGYLSKNIYRSYLESGQCYTTKKFLKNDLEYLKKEYNQM